MTNTTNSKKLNLGTTRAGKAVHWFEGSGGRGFPICNTYHSVRGAGHYRPAYGQKAPTCPKCQALQAASEGN